VTTAASVGQVVESTGIPARTLRYWLRTGRLHGQQGGGRRTWVIPAAEVARLQTWAKARL